ncbi:MAG: hypothetical protein KY391_07155 [Actinobacteria bacterium]|nr:hypothetical protein [Actinomycetota bacterium]
MSGADDYTDEMGFFDGLTDHDIEQLLAGTAPAGNEALEDVAVYLEWVRSVSLAEPHDEVAARHVMAATEAARLLAENGDPVVRPVSNAHGPALQAAGLPKWRRAMNRATSWAIKATAGGVAAALSTMGLAYAGVDLPGSAAERAVEAVLGVELPNQSGSEADDRSSVADDASDRDTEKNCEFGQSIAETAAAGSEESREDETERADACHSDEKSARGSRATGDEKSAAGRARGEDAAADGRATAETKSSAGTGTAPAGPATGESASESGQSNNPSSGADSGRDTGGSASESNQLDNPSSGSDSDATTGDTASETGQSRNPVTGGDPASIEVPGGSDAAEDRAGSPPDSN